MAPWPGVDGEFKEEPVLCLYTSDTLLVSRG